LPAIRNTTWLLRWTGLAVLSVGIALGLEDGP
jgi:hypothetical protein